jgi:hypothetical protein
MADETSNIILEHLRHMRGKLDLVANDLQSLNVRMGSVERILAGAYPVEVLQNVEIDRLKTRIDRIERRLELS